ncbi:unnamed protein product [Fraxinus pennsylvanica]|uniref:Uncharacterized protein n=1 Tax=Fraxinus pennsylvanica TaxID=56036 RepID=A0AAD1YZ69_9LAMI|nr:unnamed protein product [Fraxinus pennsylvanica]
MEFKSPEERKSVEELLRGQRDFHFPTEKGETAGFFYSIKALVLKITFQRFFMDFVTRVHNYSKKQCRSLSKKMGAVMKKVVKKGHKHQFIFQYDPSSYALNFDDGIQELGERSTVSYSKKTVTWIFVICPKV